MNAALVTARTGGKWLAITLAALVLAGCVTTPKIDWPARVGNYTCDQAVLELGPPDKQAALADHTLVAEWLTQRGQPRTFISTGIAYGSYSPRIVDTVVTPDLYLRLTFGADGRLQAWKRFAR